MDSNAIPGIGMNELLDTMAITLSRIAVDPSLSARLHSLIGTYCHQVRNHLNSLKLSLYFAKRGDTGSEDSPWTGLNASYNEMERWLDRVQLICRPLQIEPFRVPFRLFIEERRERWKQMAEARGGELEIEEGNEDLGVPIDISRLGQALDDVAAWRFQNATSSTFFHLEWKKDGDFLLFSWNESYRNSTLETTHSLAQRSFEISRDGLTIPVLARVVALHGGRTSCDSYAADWRLSIWIPLHPVSAGTQVSA